MRRMLFAGLIGVMAVVGAVSYAQEGSDGGGARRVRADLNGLQENPTLSTTGRGHLTAAIDDEARTIEYRLEYSDLEGGNATAAHIHVGTRHVNGGVSAFLCGGGGKPACPGTEGSVEGVITAADVVGPTAQGVEAGSFDELVRMIRAGATYANVHTPRWPGGEIRGQLANNSQRQMTH